MAIVFLFPNPDCGPYCSHMRLLLVCFAHDSLYWPCYEAPPHGSALHNKRGASVTPSGTALCCDMGTKGRRTKSPSSRPLQHCLECDTALLSLRHMCRWQRRCSTQLRPPRLPRRRTAVRAWKQLERSILVLSMLSNSRLAGQVLW